jgi:hypothetical protein
MFNNLTKKVKTLACYSSQIETKVIIRGKSLKKFLKRL